jgi:hypothetical protein
MGSLAAAGELAEKLGVDLRTPPKSIPIAAPTVAPCRCKDALGRHDPRLWSSPERCERCGRWLDEFIGTEYEGFDIDGVARLHEAVLIEQSKLRQEFEDCGAEDYEAWLTARIAATDAKLDKLCGRA